MALGTIQAVLERTNKITRPQSAQYKLRAMVLAPVTVGDIWIVATVRSVQVANNRTGSGAVSVGDVDDVAMPVIWENASGV